MEIYKIVLRILNTYDPVLKVHLQRINRNAVLKSFEQTVKGCFIPLINLRLIKLGSQPLGSTRPELI